MCQQSAPVISLYFPRLLCNHLSLQAYLSKFFHTLQRCAVTLNVVVNCCFSKNVVQASLKIWLAYLEMALNYLQFGLQSVCDALFKKTD